MRGLVAIFAGVAIFLIAVVTCVSFLVLFGGDPFDAVYSVPFCFFIGIAACFIAYSKLQRQWAGEQ
jgi:hypothetical protein